MPEPRAAIECKQPLTIRRNNRPSLIEQRTGLRRQIKLKLVVSNNLSNSTSLVIQYTITKHKVLWGLPNLAVNRGHLTLAHGSGAIYELFPIKHSTVALPWNNWPSPISNTLYVVYPTWAPNENRIGALAKPLTSTIV